MTSIVLGLASTWSGSARFVESCELMVGKYSRCLNCEHTGELFAGDSVNDNLHNAKSVINFHDKLNYFKQKLLLLKEEVARRKAEYEKQEVKWRREDLERSSVKSPVVLRMKWRDERLLKETKVFRNSEEESQQELVQIQSENQSGVW